jgi:hypothetical protein
MTRSHATTLPECKTSRGKSRGVGRKGPRRSACPPGQSQMGEEAVEVPRTLRGGESGRRRVR